MKTKLLTLLTLLLTCVTGAWAAVTDLAFTATKTVTAGGEIWWTTSDNVTAANTDGWCSNMATYGSTNKYGNITPSLSGDVTDTSPAYHSISGVQVKGGNAPVMTADKDGKGKKALAFKVTNTTAITVYGATTGSPARLQWSIYDASDNSAVVSSANSGDFVSQNSSSTITKTGLSASKTYIVSIEGGYKSDGNQDVVVYAVKFDAPQAGKPTINTQPISASYESGDAIAALTVAATASSGELSYQWYSCEDAEKTNPQEVGTNSASYTPTGAGYYYCNVTDGNGSTPSNVATITVVDVFTPEISYAAPVVTISYAGSGKVYYTTDGTVPSSTNGTEYTTPFNLTNSCTVRAVAKKGENYSEYIKYDCYVDQSSADGFLISTGHHSGTQAETVWTSNDGNFTLTSGGADMNWSNNIFPGMHGHKMNNGTTYTLQPSEDIKITSIKIVGRTWLDGTAATVAVSGGTPSSATWLDGETGNVSYILTKEFTTSANYGEAVTITPSGNQFGCFLEVYGVKRSGPADPEATGNVLTYTNGSVSGKVWTGTADTECEGYTITADASGTIGVKNTTMFAFANGGTYTIDVPSGVTVSSFKISGQANSSTSNVTYGEDTHGFSNSAISDYTWTVSSPSAGGSIVFSVADKQFNVASITLYCDDITLTTSDNMDGWRAFNPDGQGYTLDANTTAYIITAEKDGDQIALVKLAEPSGDIPGNTCVLLHTTSDADSHKMTLTKKTVADYSGETNKLQASTGALENVYRLGYGDDDVAFYPYSGTPAAGTVYLNVSSVAAARALNFIFDEGETTGISAMHNAQCIMHNEYYNLNGQRVAQPKKGLYIVNGKKVVIK